MKTQKNSSENDKNSPDILQGSPGPGGFSIWVGRARDNDAGRENLNSSWPWFWISWGHFTYLVILKQIWGFTTNPASFKVKIDIGPARKNFQTGPREFSKLSIMVHDLWIPGFWVWKSRSEGFRKGWTSTPAASTALYFFPDHRSAFNCNFSKIHTKPSYLCWIKAIFATLISFWVCDGMFLGSHFSDP